MFLKRHVKSADCLHDCTFGKYNSSLSSSSSDTTVVINHIVVHIVLLYIYFIIPYTFFFLIIHLFSWTYWQFCYFKFKVKYRLLYCISSHFASTLQVKRLSRSQINSHLSLEYTCYLCKLMSSSNYVSGLQNHDKCTKFTVSLTKLLIRVYYGKSYQIKSGKIHRGRQYSM